MESPVCSLQFVDTVPADEQTGEEGIAVDAVVGPGEGGHQEDGEQHGQDPHVGFTKYVMS